MFWCGIVMEEDGFGRMDFWWEYLLEILTSFDCAVLGFGGWFDITVESLDDVLRN